MPESTAPPTHDTTTAGSPAWWAAQAPSSPATRRGRPPRSFEQIVAVAAELVDTLGAGAFTMRTLAAKLRTSTATLYRHVQGKDELMVHVVDRFLGEAYSDDDRAGASSWQEGARRRLIRLHQALSAHPHVLPLLVAEVPIGPNGLAIREAALTELIEFGFSAELAARAYTTLAHYVIGFAAQEQAPGAPRPDRAVELRHYYRGLGSERFPSTVAAADALTMVMPDAEFCEGLQFILDGIDSAAKRRA